MQVTGRKAYEMLVGRPPFVLDPADTQMTALMGRIAKGRLSIPPTVSAGAAALIRALMSSNPAERPTAAEVLAHQWVVMLAGSTDEGEWA